MTEIQRSGPPEPEGESDARFRFLFEANPLPMWVYDWETLRFLEVNDAAVKLYGYSREEFLQLRITDIRPAEEVARLEQLLAQGRSALEQSGPWWHRLRDGRIIEVEVTRHLLEWRGRRAALVVAHNISDRRQAEKALAKIDTGHVDVNLQEVDLCTLLREVLNAVTPLARQQRNQISVDCPADAHVLMPMFPSSGKAS